jgi:methylthioribose-1-phosphate isomerase
MLIKNKHFQSLWFNDEKQSISIIDQRNLPFKFETLEIRDTDEIKTIIKEMYVRGAPLIGVTASYGMYLAAKEALSQKNPKAYFQKKADEIKDTRPTAVDLFKAVDSHLSILNENIDISNLPAICLQKAKSLEIEIVNTCRQIGEYGFKLIEDLSQKKKGQTINILTHCNAGWLATVDYGTATAPIYEAQKKGIDVHVWVDETRPRNQGAFLTAYELGEQGIPHTVIADNTGGHLMQHGLVDLVIVGTDRTTRQGDVANKIGTYLKALAAYDNNIPFYVAAPSSSIDFSIKDGLNEITIEERSENEVKYIRGFYEKNIVEVLLTPPNSPAKNFGFDVTPARFVTGLITERGICGANEKDILKLFPEHGTY